jgi:taurine dioxygenase
MPRGESISVRPLHANLDFGAIVEGLEPAALQDPALRRSLVSIWLERGLVVFRGVHGQDTLIELSKCFGQLLAHPIAEAQSIRREIVTIRYRPANGLVVEVDRELLGQWQPWHSDLIYMSEINRGGVMRALCVPSRRGETGFIDKIASYRALPERLRGRIEGRSVIYKFDADPERQKYGKRHEVRIRRLTDEVASVLARQHSFPRAVHPMVFVQPETGHKVLNVSPWFAVGIQGMAEDEGRALLEEVISYCIDETRAYFHRWSLDEMVLWDNWRMLHCATGSPADEERWMERTTIAGDYGLGRPEQ